MLKYSLDKIRRYGKEKENENIQFQAFLKLNRPDNIDLIINNLYSHFSSEIDCKSCANCCRQLLVTLNEGDVKRLSTCLGISRREFMESFTAKGINGGITFNFRPCPFLRNNLCILYDCRPDDCRAYPHLHEKNFIFTLKCVLNCSICPIIYYVFEGLKIITDFYGNEYQRRIILQHLQSL